MALFTKPNFNSVWASSGVKIQPEAAKINQGWIVEIPPYEYDNWLINRQDSMLAHLNQMGIPVWDNTTEYQGGKSYVQGSSTGIVYRAINTNTNINPELDIQGNWQVAFQSSGTALLKAQNLADVPDKALARQNLGISTTGDYDGRYLQRTNNLSDVPNKAVARANLDVYSKSETYSRAEVQGLLGTGMLAHFATQTPPTGWQPCDGRAISRTEYATLFAAVGTFYGAGNGTTTFNVPDLRGEFLRGWDNGRGVDTGRTFGSYQPSQNAAHGHLGTTDTQGQHEHWVHMTTATSGDHNHWVNDPGHNHIQGSESLYNFFGGGGLIGNRNYPSGPHASMTQQNTSTSATGIWLSNAGNHNHVIEGATWGSGAHTHNLNIQNSGGSEARPINRAFLICIKT